ncbi:MAG TPA: hypothetical protein VIW29_21040 [Polyangiaceae bacterium]
MPSPPPLPRFSLAAACLAHAAILSSAALTLPWRSGTSFALLLGVLTALHVTTGVAALVGRREWLVWSWRALSLSSLIAFAVLAWWMAATAIYVSYLYLRLGSTVATVIGAAAVATALLTLPIAIWGAIQTTPPRARSAKRIGTGVLTLLALAVLTLPLAASAARGERVTRASAQVTTDLSSVLEAHIRQPAAGEWRTVAGAGPARCSEPVSAEHLTLLVAYVHRTKGARSICLQASSGSKLRARFRSFLARKARPGSTVVIDLVRTVKPLEASFPLLDALELRPGLDGVCDERRCLPAWQLTLADAFAENHPLPSVPDVSYGFSAEAVRGALGASAAERDLGITGLQRIESDSFSADESGVHRLIRTRATPPALSKQGVERAVASAQRYIVKAQKRNGSFRYALDPKTGTQDSATLNLPRQAGTTYALCELGEPGAVKRTVKLALEPFAKTEVDLGSYSALSQGGDLGIGKSALPLLAMLRCRSLVGDDNDRLIGQLGRHILRMQRDDGSFYPAFDPKLKRGVGDHEAVYAAGQAVLALVLLEQQRAALVGSAAEPLPEPARLKSALDRAMSYYAGPYWPTPARDFFFFEEGWHCLAARTALSSHRHDGYEQLCIDYVSSRLRYVTRAADTSEPNFVGGYGVSDLFPPRNTATAGMGEALNASITIKRKRGEPVERELEILRDLVTFLLRAQWTEAGCYACRQPHRVVGGFSQQLASPSIRIDYVQHAMAAIGHGSKLLGLM